MSGDRDRHRPGELDDPFPDAADSPFAEFSLRRKPTPASPPGPFDPPPTSPPAAEPLDDPFAAAAPPPSAPDTGPFGGRPRPEPTATPRDPGDGSEPAVAERRAAAAAAHEAPRGPASAEPEDRPASGPTFEPLFAALQERRPEPELDEPVPEPPRSRRRLLVVLAAAAVLVVAAYLFRGTIAGMLPDRQAEPVGAASVGAAGVDAGPAVAEPAGPGAAESTDPSAAAVDVAESSLATAPVRSPAPTLPPAGALADVSWQVQGGATVVTVTVDGSIAPDRVASLHLDAPARQVVKVAGVDGRFGNRTLAVGTPQVTRIRTGYHRETSPPEMHIVIDLAGTAVRAAEPLVENDRIILVFAPGL